MPWHVESDNPECEGFAVVKDDDGAIEGCHATEEAANDQLAALYAAEAELEADGAGDEDELELELAPIGRAARADKLGREERRGTVEMREISEGAGGLEVYGLASPTNVPYTVTDMFGDYTETVSSGAFERTITEQDVRLYVNHEGMALARSSAPGELGRLELRESEAGLEYEARLPAISIVRDLEELMRAGIMRESSFAFQPIRQKWSKDYTERELLEVKLYDVSVVSHPANPDATAGVRDAELVRWLAELPVAEVAGELRRAGVGEGSIAGAIAKLAHTAAEVREGKVLSAANAKLVREAVEALEALLNASGDRTRDAGGMMIQQAVMETMRRR